MTIPQNQISLNNLDTLDATEAWINSIREVLEKGHSASPRDLDTKEVLCQQITFDMNRPICAHQERKLSYKFMAAEAYWITQGSPLVEDIAPYNAHIANYSDDGYIFNGAYGPAFISQLEFVVNKLRKDPTSRQSVMTIWHPNPIDSKDHKCTVALMFYIRNSALHPTVIMRSNDLILGRPYDMFNFTIMSLRVLTKLNSKAYSPFVLGNMTLFANSAHIYSNNRELCEQIVETPIEQITEPVPYEATIDWQFVVDSLLACRDNEDTTDLWRIRP